MRFDLDISQNFPLKFLKSIWVECRLYFLNGDNSLLVFTDVNFTSTTTSYDLLKQDLVWIHNYLLIFPQYFN